MKIEELQQSHLDELRVTVQPIQTEFSEMLWRSPDFLAEMREAGPCRAFVSGPRVLGCAGLINFANTGRSVLWCAYAEELGVAFAAIFKSGMQALFAEDWRRVEAWLIPDFPAGKRLARLAGFEYEGTMRKFWSDGADRELWARTR